MSFVLQFLTFELNYKTILFIENAKSFYKKSLNNWFNSKFGLQWMWKRWKCWLNIERYLVLHWILIFNRSTQRKTRYIPMILLFYFSNDNPMTLMIGTNIFVYFQPAKNATSFRINGKLNYIKTKEPVQFKIKFISILSIRKKWIKS